MNGASYMLSNISQDDEEIALTILNIGATLKVKYNHFDMEYIYPEILSSNETLRDVRVRRQKGT